MKNREFESSVISYGSQTRTVKTPSFVSLRVVLSHMVVKPLHCFS